MAVKLWRMVFASPSVLPHIVAGSNVKGERGTAHMQLDGEPWAQDIPAGDAAPLVVSVFS